MEASLAWALIVRRLGNFKGALVDNIQKIADVMETELQRFVKDSLSFDISDMSQDRKDKYCKFCGRFAGAISTQLVELDREISNKAKPDPHLDQG